MKAGYYWWEHRAQNHARVCLTYSPGKIDVDVWWNVEVLKPGKIANIRMRVSHREGFVELIDLVGNMYQTPLHQKGFGTFVANVAIQVMKQTKPPKTIVTGTLSNPLDKWHYPDQEARLAQIRRCFWERFGLTVDWKGEYEKLYGTVEMLRCVHTGLVADQFPRYVPLSEFIFSDESVGP